MKHVLSIIVLLILIMITVCEAQERIRRVKPAFPIGAGEEMIILSGREFWQDFGNVNQSDNQAYSANFASTKTMKLNFPVGTTIKRVLGEFVDQQTTASKDLTVRLLRVKYDENYSTAIVMRSFNTSGISSSSATDFKQIVGNPISHVTLQGYLYIVEVAFPDGTVADEIALGIIKVIYEP